MQSAHLEKKVHARPPTAIAAAAKEFAKTEQSRGRSGGRPLHWGRVAKSRGSNYARGPVELITRQFRPTWSRADICQEVEEDNMWTFLDGAQSTWGQLDTWRHDLGRSAVAKRSPSEHVDSRTTVGLEKFKRNESDRSDKKRNSLCPTNLKAIHHRPNFDACSA